MSSSPRKHARTAVLALLVLSGCHAILGLDDPIVDSPSRADAGDDVSVLGPAIDGATSDGQSLGDAGLDADAEPPVVIRFHEDWDQPRLWNHVDLKALNVGTTTFVGAVFDGQYIYFAPSTNANVPTFAARYDTKGGGLTAVAAWRFFDTSLLSPDARGFEGAFFDGRYITFVPFATDAVGHSGRFTRFDTKAGRDFTDPVAWSTFDTTTLNQNAKGYIGGVFDGDRYAYVAPGLGNFEPGVRAQAIAARLDTKADWTTGSAWELFDTQTIAPTLDGGGPRGFVGTVDTGSHVYFVPYGYAGAYRGRTVRFDRAKPFTAPSSWEVFDITTLDPNGVGFQGAGFDGRYVYYVPLVNGAGGNGLVVRYDTQKAFAEAASWSTYDVESHDGGLVPSQADGGAAPVRKAYVGAGFDGRYMYFAPGVNVGAPSSWLARFDTQKTSLSDPTAWSFYDLESINPGAHGMCGAVFDARYMYVVPCFTSTVIRFDTLETEDGRPAPLPRLPHAGSFL